MSKEPDKLNPTYEGVSEVINEVARAVVEERDPNFEGHNPLDVTAAGVVITEAVVELEEEEEQTTIEFK